MGEVSEEQSDEFSPIPVRPSNAANPKGRVVGCPGGLLRGGLGKQPRWVQAVNATRYLFADEDGVLYEQMNLCAILARDSKRYLDAL